MPKKDFCCVENYSVLIPYKDLEKLVNIAQNVDTILARVKKIDERYAALQNLYSETLLKLDEINRML